jgi:hypothetical protein
MDIAEKEHEYTMFVAKVRRGKQRHLVATLASAWQVSKPEEVHERAVRKVRAEVAPPDCMHARMALLARLSVLQREMYPRDRSNTWSARPPSYGPTRRSCSRTRRRRLS